MGRNPRNRDDLSKTPKKGEEKATSSLQKDVTPNRQLLKREHKASISGTKNFIRAGEIDGGQRPVPHLVNRKKPYLKLVEPATPTPLS